ncbi:MAG: hypothetical protein ABFD60_01700 [Bryobacteraceae bacterium]
MNFLRRLREDAEKIRHDREQRGEVRQPHDPNVSPLAGIKVADPAVQVAVDHLAVKQVERRRELDILRKTRGQREVGSLEVPVALQGALIVRLPEYQGQLAKDRNSPDGVETRAMLAGGDPQE